MRKARAKTEHPAAERQPQSTVVGRSASKALWFRLAAVTAIPLLSLLLVEGALRLCGYGYATHFFLKRLRDGQALWTDNQNFGRRFFPAGLVRYAKPFDIPIVKAPNTLRIFVFGESAAMGDPDPKFGLPKMLEVMLRDRYPDRRIEVINAAMVAIDSHVALPIARDCANRQADLWVVYMGNNEVIGPYGSASVFGAQAPSLPIVRSSLWLKTTRIGQLVDALVQYLNRARLPAVSWKGMEMMSRMKVARDSPATARVRRHFQRNLQDILDIASSARVPVVLCTVGTNLKDCAPFASLHKAGLTAAELGAWQSAYDSGVEHQERGELQDAAECFERAAQIDSGYADLAFRRAQCLLQLGKQSDAAKLFAEARDLDALQFRTDGALNAAIRTLAGNYSSRGVYLLEAEEMLAASSPQGIPGNEFFYEHVHLRPEGNYLLARSIAEKALQVLSLPSRGQWVGQDECFRSIGLTDWSRQEALSTMVERAQLPPFTTQIDHKVQLQILESQLAKCRAAGKPARLKRDLQELAALVERHPEDPDLRWNLAATLEATGEGAQAEKQWRFLIDIQPQASLPRINLGRLLEQLGRPEEALPLYEAGLATNPEYHPARIALGVLCSRTGRLQQAITHLRIFVRHQPDSLDGRLALARALSALKQEAAAREQWGEALRLDPANAEARSHL